jgi:hypothetical protein
MDTDNNKMQENRKPPSLFSLKKINQFLWSKKCMGVEHHFGKALVNWV